jgi:uncharacterized membrane protein
MSIDLSPLLAAPLYIQMHAFAAMAAFLLGIVQLAAPKGTLPHRTIGTVWVVLIGIVVISSIFIQRPVGPGDPFLARFSWIHILTLTTALALLQGVFLILFGGAKMKRHRGPFIAIFIGGLVIAGALTFAPGRIMHEVAFGARS